MAKRAINYFDLGLFRGIELGWMANDILPKTGHPYQAYGFEAHPLYCEPIRNKFKEEWSGFY